MTFIIKTVKNIIQAMTIAMAAAVAVILMPIIFGMRPYVVLSGSMEPAIKTGAITYIQSAIGDYQIGDVIMFRYSGDVEPVTHRIMQKNGVYYITKGDSNKTNDATPITEQQIMGKVSFSIPYAGYLVHAFQTRRGKLMIFYLILMNIFFCVFTTTKRREKNE